MCEHKILCYLVAENISTTLTLGHVSCSDYHCLGQELLNQMLLVSHQTAEFNKYI